MPQMTKKKAQSEIDALNVSTIVPECVTTQDLYEDVERLALLVVELAGEVDQLRDGGAR